MNRNEIKIEIPNFNELEKIETITLLDKYTKEPLGTLDEETSRLIVQYAELNFLTIEEALVKLLKMLIKNKALESIKENPLEAVKNPKKYVDTIKVLLTNFN